MAAIVTLVVSVAPFASWAYRSPTLHVALETAAGLISLLAAYLLAGRFLETARVRDLVLASSLAVFAATNLALSAAPGIAAEGRPGGFSTWAPLAGRLLGAGLLAAAPFVRDAHVARPARSLLLALLSVTAALAVVGAAVAVIGSDLPTGLDPDISPATATPGLVGHPGVHAAQLLAMAFFAVAAVGFARTARTSDDELTRWLGPAAAIAAFARVNYFLFPSQYSEWVYTGDLLRVAFYLLVLLGVAREVGRYQRECGRAATLEERRRVARELHDGLAQELAYIVMETRRLLQTRDDEPTARVSLAAGRALDESRRAIAALTRPLDEPLPLVLGEVAEEVAGRAGLELELDLEEGVDVAPETREDLLRIVREAITNAARHAHASRVRVELSAADGRRLRIVDDGEGFDPDAVTRSGARGGFGLKSMRERAQNLGGRVDVRSRPGAGTSVEVVLP